MATGGAGTASPQPIVQPLHRGNAPAPTPINTVSPPSKRELASWWKKFRKTTETKDEKPELVANTGIFGVPLADSIRYANVAISLQNENGESFIYGYVPIVVAKCGVYLKEKAVDVEGIFRLSGSAKRIKDLQTIFDSPDRYGKGLDWTGYTVHDAANILRRYLNQLPEPIVPLDFYERFREPLRRVQVSGPDGQPQQRDLSVDEHSAAVATYQRLITELPPLNRQLLLYLLDLLAVFASKSDLNRMTAPNLAAIFQPGIISHPSHDMSPIEYRLSQDVLIFLIEGQDNFLVGMSGTAVDAQTQKDVESGAPSLRSPKAVGRSASNASAGADSLRKFGVRRNVSVSSRGSKERGSPGVSSPGTPSGVTSFSGNVGVARSNTVPSKRSPAITANRFPKVSDNSDSTIQTVGPQASTPVSDSVQEEPIEPTVSNAEPGQTDNVPSSASTEPMPQMPTPIETQQDPTQTPVSAPAAAGQTFAGPVTSTGAPAMNRDRKISNLFTKSPSFGPTEPPGRQPRKLQKKQKIPGSSNESAQSSVNSLHGGDDLAAYHTPMMSPDLNSAVRHDPLSAPQGPALTSTAATPVSETSTPRAFNTPSKLNEGASPTPGLKPPTSPPGSTRSRSSFTDQSDNDVLNEVQAQPEKERHRHRFRFSSSAKKGEHSPLVPPPPVGQHAGARGSNSSVGSSRGPRKSFTGDSQLTQSSVPDPSISGQQTLVGHSSQDSHEGQKDVNGETEKKGLFGKWKAKMSQSKEERQAEKERAKSPPRSEQNASRNSLAAFVHDHSATRGRSFDKAREDGVTNLPERPVPEGMAQTTGRKVSMEPGSRPAAQ